MNDQHNEASGSSSKTQVFENSLKQLWETIFHDSQSVLADAEQKIADCFGIEFERLLESPAGDKKIVSGLNDAVSAVAAELVNQLSSEAGYLHKEHVLALARLLPVLQFVELNGYAPSDVRGLKSCLAEAVERHETGELGQVSLAFLELYCREVLGDKSQEISLEKLHSIFLHLQSCSADDLVGIGEALHCLGAKELAEICFMRAQDADKPLAALATLRSAQYDTNLDHIQVRFAAAARGIAVGWAIAGFGLLKEAIDLLLDVAARVNEKTLDLFFDFLDGDDVLAKIVFPDTESRGKLKNGFFTREEILNRIIDCLPRYHVQLATSMLAGGKADVGRKGNA